MRPTLIALALTLVPAALAAQSVSVGGGPGVTGNAVVTSGFHGTVSLPVARVGSVAQLRAEALYLQSRGDGNPFECETVESFYCLGRTDLDRVAAAGVYARINLRPVGPVRPYLAPLGLGVYRRWTRTDEFQGPTGICVEGGELVSCANNPPFETFVSRSAATSPGFSTGAGLDAPVLGRRVFVEMRGHWLLEDRGTAVAVPVTVGVSF
ncbi:MAG TPA: hypothetical protein VF746_01685 [Longimicrobium sp.]|jgi:hypothetical protein